MSMNEPEPVLVARGTDVERLMRTARAEIAQLSLQIRSVDHEADELEADLASDDTSARDLLRVSLDELVESRRLELEQVLEQELVRAAAVVSEAQGEEARSRLEPGPTAEAPAQVTPALLPLVPGPIPPRRLQVVVDDRDDEDDGDVEDEPETPQGAEPHAVTPSAETALVVNARRAGAVPAPLLAAPAIDVAPAPQPLVEPDRHDEEPEATPEPAPTSPGVEDHDAAWVSPETEPTVRPGVPPIGDVPADPALLRELVSAAVTAAVGQAINAIDGGAARARGASPPQWGPEGTGVHAAIPVQPMHPARPPLWRQLLHLDVLLPLVLVIIVFVVLLAWVG